LKEKRKIKKVKRDVFSIPIGKENKILMEKISSFCFIEHANVSSLKGH
jgi:hypothetical protein